MIKNKFVKFVILFSAIFYANIVSANNLIYYIDIDFLMNNSLAGKSIIKQLDDKNKFNKKKFKKSEENLKNEEMKLISKKNILNKEEYIKKVQLFKKKISNYQLSRTNTINNVSKMKNSAQKMFIDKLTAILAEYAEKNSISYIIPKQSIIIAKTELNLTNIILKILDSKIKNIEVK